ncbi:MAG: HAD family hydrolase [Bacteroidales bacterium]|nr:HAD family hydrolase [Bacteroidales bacterium]
MADNYLERQLEDYEARRQAKAKAAKLAWQKRLKAYQKRLKTEQKNPKNYIFDFDGTLMDTAPVILITMAQAIEEMRLPARTEEECRATIGIRLEEVADYLYPGHPGIGPEYAATYRRIFARNNLPGVATPYPGVIDTLRALHQSGHPLAIASSRSRASLDEFVSSMGITDCIVMTVGGDDVTKGKPDPEPVLKILSQLGWNPKETLVVGDAPVDILMGKGAGCLTCAVTYGNSSLPTLQASHPDCIISSFTELNPEISLKKSI